MSNIIVLLNRIIELWEVVQVCRGSYKRRIRETFLLKLFLVHEK